MPFYSVKVTEVYFDLRLCKRLSSRKMDCPRSMVTLLNLCPGVPILFYYCKRSVVVYWAHSSANKVFRRIMDDRFTVIHAAGRKQQENIDDGRYAFSFLRIREDSLYFVIRIKTAVPLRAFYMNQGHNLANILWRIWSWFQFCIYSDVRVIEWIVL